MATLINIKDMSQYPNVVREVVQQGEARSPRGIETLDLGHTVVTIDDPTRCLATGIGRGLNTKIAAAEAVQLIGGFHDEKLMLWASPNFAKFMDQAPGGRPYFHGAYGRRIGTQMSDVQHKLRVDAETRQAVVTLWDPDRDNQRELHDYPCTVGFGFQIVNGRLNMGTVMRSNDVWLGFPYDVFQFTQLQLSLAISLGVQVGTYEHYAWSLHLYKTDLEKIDNLAFDPAKQILTGYQPKGIGDNPFFNQPRRDFASTRGMAQMLPYVEVPDDLIFTSDSERWYISEFANFNAGFGVTIPKADVG